MKTKLAFSGINAETQRPLRNAEKIGFVFLCEALRSLRLCVYSRLGLLLLCAVALAPGSLKAATNDLTGALQKGLFEEEANQNLEAAAQAYQAVSAQFDKDRKLAATAIFRLGEVYRKQNKTNEAVAHYERILREFSDQSNLVTLSRQNLGAMSSRGDSPSVPAMATDPRAFSDLERELAMLKAQVAEARRETNLTVLIPYLNDTNLTITFSELKWWRNTYVDPTNAGVVRIMQSRERALTNAFDNWFASQDLRRRVLESAIAQAKGVGPIESSGTAAITTDEEEKEIRRIQALIQNSPDLINARDQPRGATPLHNAAGAARMTVAKFLLASGADIEAKDNIYGGATPLHYAADGGHKAMVELLLSHGAKVKASTSDGNTPLHFAARRGFKSVVEVLLAAGADVDAKTANNESTPLHLAAVNGFKNVAETLLKAKANPNLVASQTYIITGGSYYQGTPLGIAIQREDRALADLLLTYKADVNLPDRAGVTPLFNATQCARPEFLELLLARKADANIATKEGNTPLFNAITLKQISFVKQLLAHQANPDTCGKFREGVSATVGMPPLRLAARRGDEEIVRLLLEHGASINATQTCAGTIYGPPIFTAIHYNQTNVLKLLLEFKADPTARDVDGTPPLVACANNNRPVAAALLLAQGANVEARDALGSTPLVTAAINKQLELAKVLLAHKADPNQTARARWSSSGLAEDSPLRYAIWSSPPNPPIPGSTPGEKGQIEMSRLLLENGANPNGPGKDSQAKPLQGFLFTAILYAPSEVVELVLERGADVNARDELGNTPLHLAAYLGKKHIVEALLEKKANPNLQNNQSWTPLDVVKNPQFSLFRLQRPPISGTTQQEITAELKQHGALDELPDFNRIRVTRVGLETLSFTVFQKSTNENHFTLLDALFAKYFDGMSFGIPPRPRRNDGNLYTGKMFLEGLARSYTGGSDLPFPDLRRITVVRPSQKAGQPAKRIPVDLILPTGLLDCAKDLPLEFGDQVEIPEREHTLEESAGGLTITQMQEIARCREGSVNLRVRGKSTELKVWPFRNEAALPRVLERTEVRSELFSSSDLSRIKVTRRDKQEFIVDCTGGQSPDFWLRDGDVVEVPDKP